MKRKKGVEMNSTNNKKNNNKERKKKQELNKIGIYPKILP